MFEGSLESKILIISDFQRSDEAFFGFILSDQRKQIITGALSRAGIPESDYAFTIMYPWKATDSEIAKESQEKKLLALMACKKLINESQANVIVPLGEHALRFITGLNGVQDHKCTVVKVKAEFGDRKAIPLPHPEQVQKVWSDHAYVSFGCSRIKSEFHSKKLDHIDRKFSLSLDLSFEQIVSYLEDKVLKAPELSVDYETGRNQINTVGYAISPSEAIAIDVLPSSYSPAQFYKLWSLIGEINRSEIPKISQNAIYESIWSSQYGLEFNAVKFDTMTAMKMLHPMLEKGLDNVGRLYTKRPYWKKDHSDWNNVRNWRSHLTYNCDDTSGTFEAKIGLEAELASRGLLERYRAYMDRIFPALQRMTNEGILISKERLETFKITTEDRLNEKIESFNQSTTERVGRIINPNSPKQVKEFLKEINIKLPTKAGQETVNKEALKKLTKSYPKEILIKRLIDISKFSSQLETYCNFKYDNDSRLRFSVDMFHNEFGEISTSKNPFGSGFSLDDMPRKTKSFMVAEEDSWLFEVGFYKPEQTYLAYDSGEQKMISMLREDIPEKLGQRMFLKVSVHPFSEEYRIAESAIYAAAYGMSPRAFAIQTSATIRGISDNDARKYLGIVFEFFPKLRKRQEDIQYSLRHTRTLTNLMGSKITFYDRFNDELFRKAYQWGYRSLMADMIKNTILAASLDVVAITGDSVLYRIGKNSEEFEGMKYLPTPKFKNHFGEFNFYRTFKAGDSWGSLQNV